MKILSKLSTLDPLYSNIWFGYLFWSFILELVSSVYYLNLATLGINSSISILLVILFPALLGFSKIRTVVGGYYIHLMWMTLPALLLYHSVSPTIRAVLVGLGFGFLFLSISYQWVYRYEGEAKHVNNWASFIGLILLIALKWVGMSRNPLWINWGFSLVGSIITITFIMSRVLDGYGDSEPEDSQPKLKMKEWIYTSFSFAMIIFISSWIFSSYSVIPRWTGVEPAYGLFIILALVAGIFFRNTILIKIGFWGLLGLSGIILMGFISGLIGFAGGVILAFVFPSYWKIVITNLKNVPPGRTFIVSGLLILIFIFGSIFTVTFDYVPLGFLFKQREEPLLILAYLIAVFLHQEFLLIKPGVKIQKPRKQFFVVLSIILVLLVPAGGIYRYSRGIDEPVGNIDSFSVMTYNIQQGFDESGNVNFNTVADNIRLADPFIVGLQETDTLRISSSNRDVMEWLGNELLMYSYAGPLTRDSTFGNGMLSKFEFISKKTTILPSEGELAVIQLVTVTINNQVINILNAHFGETEADRTAQAQYTRDMIEDLDGPVILMGDFNSEPNSSQMQFMYDIGMINAYGEYTNGSYAATHLNRNSIDFIMYRDLTLISVDVYSDLTGSDHFPVYAEFDI